MASPEERAGPEIAVAVVGAKTPGNIGTIARAMKNYGLSELLLVDPPALDPDGEAYGFAGQAREDILPNADEISFEDLTENYYTVGCTATTNEDPANHMRYPAKTPRELADSLEGIDSTVAIVFGRERVGLTNEELERIDTICSIPASAEYPSLNLGQAATIVLYELRDLALSESQHPEDLHRRAPQPEIERLHDQFAAYLDAIDHPENKQPKARRLFRRLLGRADPTPREVRTMQGLLRTGTERSESWHPDRE
ncbi:TrmJ/YjtD family RNA methyltransferase [Halobacteriaceae archaeon SHR40]|uniref:RNA methyltransferase n=1 Tax=Halovenus amylolytica TaxID=2500550 RepID=UPI000FE39901